MNTGKMPDWDERYRSVGEDYLFGKAPNEYLATKVAHFSPGQKAICLADGEGRNSVWLARLGLEVTAVEQSLTALRKAERLAAEEGVPVAFRQGDMLAEDWPAAGDHRQYDWVVAIFVQFVDASRRVKQFRDLKALCKPGGRILLMGYTPRQLEYGTGGPSEIGNLYTPELLEEAFRDWHVEELRAYEKVLDEGIRHRGLSAVIGMVARSPG